MQVTARESERFDFLNVTVSVIVGLGITHILEFVAFALNSSDVASHGLRLCWSAPLLLLFVMLWFTQWRFRAHLEGMTFFPYCVWLLSPAFTFLVAALILPMTNSTIPTDIDRTPWAFGVFAFTIALYIVLGTFVLRQGFFHHVNLLRLLVLAVLLALTIWPDPRLQWIGIAVVTAVIVILGKTVITTWDAPDEDVSA